MDSSGSAHQEFGNDQSLKNAKNLNRLQGQCALHAGKGFNLDEGTYLRSFTMQQGDIIRFAYTY